MIWKKVLLKYKSFSEFNRMILTAIIGVIIGFFTYEIIYYVNPINPRATSSWVISFVIGVVRQHGLHRWLTFEESIPYWRSLFKAYIMYSSSLILSTSLNLFLVEYIDLNHRLAWILCIAMNGGVSLFFLKRFVFSSKKDNS